MLLLVESVSLEDEGAGAVGLQLVKCNYSITIQRILPNQTTLSDDGEKDTIIVSDLKTS